VDAPLLARLCMALAYADEATAQVQAVGLLVKAPNTKLPIQSPWLAIMNRQTEIARKLTRAGAPAAQRSRAGKVEGRPPRRPVEHLTWWRSRVRHGRRHCRGQVKLSIRQEGSAAWP
jgi:hypothetical protein